MGDSKSQFQLSVERVVRGIVAGDVLSYAETAVLAGRPGAARAVGRALARSSDIPWWRVATANGRLVPGREREQARRLLLEGVAIDFREPSVPRVKTPSAKHRLRPAIIPPPRSSTASLG